jgi:hypothetical protein
MARSISGVAAVHRDILIDKIVAPAGIAADLPIYRRRTDLTI